MGSELGRCVRCKEWTEVEEFDDGLLCNLCYEDLCSKAGELTETQQQIEDDERSETHDKGE